MTDRENIEELFKKGQTLFYSDIANELNIDFEVVVNICDELYKEGKIEIDDTIVTAATA